MNNSNKNNNNNFDNNWLKWFIGFNDDEGNF